ARRACNASRCQLAHPPRREWPFSAALRPASFPSRCSSTFVNAWREDTDGTPDPDRAGIRRQHETEPARVDACAAPPAPGGGTLVVAELDEVRPGRKPEVTGRCRSEEHTSELQS